MLRYQIFDLSGKEVSSLCQMEESELGIRVGTSGLANGVYHLAVYDHQLKLRKSHLLFSDDKMTIRRISGSP